MHRREVLRLGALGAGALGSGVIRSGPASASRALPASVVSRLAGVGPRTCQPGSPYGPLQAPDVNGIALPAGFSSRVIGRTGQAVASTGYVWHRRPDGGACVPTDGGGWIYVSNAESHAPAGGVGAVRFDVNGGIVDAYRICSGTSTNCSGGLTPWGTWMSCEEIEFGRVWECDPFGAAPAVAHPQLGRFRHEALAFDAPNGHVYLTEDRPDGRWYRYRYDDERAFAAGMLEVAVVGGPLKALFMGDRAPVSWVQVPDPSASFGVTRRQVPEATVFAGAEGIWCTGDTVYVATSGTNQIWAYDLATSELSLFYDLATSCHPVLSGVDDVIATPTGQVFVCEDKGNMQLVVLSADGSLDPFLQVYGQDASELTGAAFNPGGDRLYVSSQHIKRNSGITYEIVGPFDYWPAPVP